jgi:hypothetical protein
MSFSLLLSAKSIARTERKFDLVLHISRSFIRSQYQNDFFAFVKGCSE